MPRSWAAKNAEHLYWPPSMVLSLQVSPLSWLFPLLSIFSTLMASLSPLLPMQPLFPMFSSCSLRPCSRIVTWTHATLSVISVDLFDIHMYTRSAKQAFTVCPDEMPPTSLKLGDDEISTIPTKILNLTLSQQIFPDNLRYYIMFPTHKRGLISSVSNFRPIYCTSPISKVF